MITTKNLSPELNRLLQERGQVCMSILLPTHRIFPDSSQDPIRLKKAITEAMQALQKVYPEQDSNFFEEALGGLTENLDVKYNLDGLGLFISPNVRIMMRFPFPVEEKIIVTNNFELSDILYRLNYAQPYFVLMLSEKRMRLFRGSWEHLEELKDGFFPEKYEEKYEYDTPVRAAASSGYGMVKGFEKDRSVIEEQRFKAFFRQTNERLKPYLQEGTPLVIVGPEEEIVWFENVTQYGKQIAGHIKGNYDHLSASQLAELVWPVVREYFYEIEKKRIQDFRETFGTRRGICGLLPAWKAAAEGRAHQLLVEKDFHHPGFKTLADGLLHVNVPPVPHTLLPDAVDDLMELVLKKNGEIHFVDNNTLEEFDRIALVTRY
jgi:hypothetical protein